MKSRLSRRRFGAAVPLIVGESALLSACGAPALRSPGRANDSTPAPEDSVAAEVAPFPLSRPNLGRRGSAKLEYANLPAGGTLTLLDLQEGPGYVSHLWCAVSCTDPAGQTLTRYRVVVDGEAAPSIDSTLVGYHAADGATTSGAARYIGFDHNATLASYYSYLPLPFRSSIRIEVVNGSRDTPAVFFAIADYHLVGFSWGRAAKLHTFEQEVTVAPYVWQNLLDVRRSNGVLAGVYLRMHGGDPTWGYLEGNVQMFADGSTTPCYESSGTEDYFNNAWYFQTGVILADQSGCTAYDPAGFSVGAYRFHLDDPVPFDTALRVRWQNGTADQAKVLKPTTLRSHVWYYTAG